MAESRIEEFIHYLTVEKRYSQHTCVAYEEDLTQFKVFAELTSNEHWKEVNHQMMRSWLVDLVEKEIKSRSIARKLSAMRAFYKWQIREGLCLENPMLRIKAPKVEKRNPNFVKESELEIAAQVDLFGDHFEGRRDQLMVELFYQTGIRLSELIGCKERDVQSDHIKVLGKRNKERIIPIGKELYDLIQAYRKLKPSGPDSEDLLMVDKKGRKLYPNLVYRKINAYIGSVSNVQKKSPHVLRHTFATHMLNNGAGLETLKELLGHANLSATQVYTHNSFAQINSIYSQAHPRGRKKD